jgi:hypothetical protein
MCRRSGVQLYRPVREVDNGPTLVTAHGPTLGPVHHFVFSLARFFARLVSRSSLAVLLVQISTCWTRKREIMAGTRWCSFNLCTVPTPVADGTDPECGSAFHGRVTAIKENRSPNRRCELPCRNQKKTNKQASRMRVHANLPPPPEPQLASKQACRVHKEEDALSAGT